ncbi:hypothetical protein D3C72_2179280 [compost metagenome]
MQVAFQPRQVLADGCRTEAEDTGTSSDATGLDHLDEAANGVEQVHGERLDS